VSTIRLLAGLACLSVPGVALAAPPERAIDESHPGHVYYRKYCASCHGLFADGLGPVAPALRSRPPDLTHLQSKYGDPLPRAALMNIIAGKDMVRAHGNADMPVWGEAIREDLPPSPGKEPARRQILQLVVDYLEEIQPPREADDDE